MHICCPVDLLLLRRGRALGQKQKNYEMRKKYENLHFHDE